MKNIIFFRHGKSDWNTDFEHDLERPLKKRGEKAACLMGKFLSRVGLAPDLILTSPAVRARTTAFLAAETGGWQAPVQESDALYGGGPDQLLAAIRATDTQVNTLLVVGHEPTWSETMGRLIGQAQLRFPTAAMACVEVDVNSWQDVTFSRGTLMWLVPPKLLKAAVE